MGSHIRVTGAEPKVCSVCEQRSFCILERVMSMTHNTSCRVEGPRCLRILPNDCACINTRKVLHFLVTAGAPTERSLASGVWG